MVSKKKKKKKKEATAVLPGYSAAEFSQPLALPRASHVERTGTKRLALALTLGAKKADARETPVGHGGCTRRRYFSQGRI